MKAKSFFVYQGIRVAGNYHESFTSDNYEIKLAPEMGGVVIKSKSHGTLHLIPFPNVKQVDFYEPSATANSSEGSSQTSNETSNVKRKVPKGTV